MSPTKKTVIELTDQWEAKQAANIPETAKEKRWNQQQHQQMCMW